MFCNAIFIVCKHIHELSIFFKDDRDEKYDWGEKYKYVITDVT